MRNNSIAKMSFEEGELTRDSVVANFATTAADGKIYQVYYYNLDVVISVGYRVKSIVGTHFRQWAMQRIKEYMIKVNVGIQKISGKDLDRC